MCYLKCADSNLKKKAFLHSRVLNIYSFFKNLIISQLLKRVNGFYYTAISTRVHQQSTTRENFFLPRRIFLFSPLHEIPNAQPLNKHGTLIDRITRLTQRNSRTVLLKICEVRIN